MRGLLPILHLTGFTMLVFSLTMLLPVGVAYYTDDGTLFAFLDAMGIALVAGGLMYGLTRRHQRELHPRDGFLLVSLVWTVLPALAAIPLYLHFERTGEPISVSYAYFEAVSGLTTTGATVLSVLHDLPASIHVWRAVLAWVGGMGILVLTVAILPLLGVGGSQVVRAETPGPMKDEKLTPRMASTAKGLYAIFVSMSVLCWIAYTLAGLEPLDAFVHMCATVALGGFSTLDGSIGGFHSLPVEMVALVFMLVGGVSYMTHFSALRTRSLKAYLVCPQTTTYLWIMAGTAATVVLYLIYHRVYPSIGEALRYGAFNAVSVATTTGFASTDYASWPAFAPWFMLVVSCFAASAGSTGGGIKLIRLVLLVRQARYELLRLVHPRVVAPLRLGQQLVDTRVLLGVMGFMLLYLTTLTTATLLLMLSGLDGLTAFTAAISSLNNTGAGLGAVGPSGSYGGMSDIQIWICTFVMLLGRLELATLLVLFTPMFWNR